MAAQEKLRPHHSYVWLGALRVIPPILIVIACASIGPLVEEGMGDPDSALTYAIFIGGCLAITIVVAAVVLLVRFIEYRYIWYEFGTTEFSYYSGILSKRRVHVPYQKVQSVNEKASLLQRVVGVYTVRIETAGGADNKAVEVGYLTRAATERMRTELFLHKQLIDAGWSAEAIDAHFASLAQQYASNPGAPVDGSQAPVPPWVLEAQMNAYTDNTAPEKSALGTAQANGSAPQGENILDQPAAFMHDIRGVFGGAAIDTGHISYEYGLSNKELILAAISGKSSWSLAVIGVIVTLASILSFFLDANIIDQNQAEYGAQVFYSSLSSAPIMFGVVVSIVGCLLLIWVVLVVGSLLTYGGFKARRRDDRIEVEHGLITHVVHGMSIERIQTIKVHQTFFQRLLGYCSVSYGRVAALTDSSEQSASVEQASLVVHPFLPLKRVQEVVSQLTPEYAALPEVSKRVAPVAQRRAVTRRALVQGVGFWMIVGVLLGWLGLQALMRVDNTVSARELQYFTETGLLVVVALLVMAVIIAIVEVIGAFLWYRYSAFGYDAHSLTLVNGGFSIDTTTVPRNKIQMAYIKTNPLQRHAQVATIVAINAAGSGSLERLIDVSVTDAQQWLAWVQPRGHQ